MATVAHPIMVTVIRKAPLRPTLSPTRPKISAPMGRKKKPAPKSPRAASRPEVGSSSVKKFRAVTGASAPKTKKSYHSKVKPRVEAITTSRRDAADGPSDRFAMPLAPAPIR